MQPFATPNQVKAFHKILASDLQVWLKQDISVSLTPWAVEADMPFLLSTAAGRAAFSKFWADFASRYAHLSPRLLSFEILNEPSSITGSIASDCTFPACAPPIWRDYQNRFIQSIRSAAPGHTILVTGADFSKIPALVQLEPYSDPNLIYVFHLYPADLFVGQNAWVPEYGIRYPACMSGNQQVVSAILENRLRGEAQRYLIEDWGPVKLSQFVADARDWSTRNGVHLFANEVAAFSADNESRVRWVRDSRRALEAQDIPWSVWSVADYYTRGWVPGQRQSDTYLLRGTAGIPWTLSEPACSGDATQRIDVAASIGGARDHIRIRIENKGDSDARNVEARILISNGSSIIRATPDFGACTISRSVVTCRVGQLISHGLMYVHVVTSEPDHRVLGLQVVVVGEGTDIDETNNFNVRLLTDLDHDGMAAIIDDDNDGDGLLNEYELHWGLSASNSSDQLDDHDEDGYSNLAEMQDRNGMNRFGTNPRDRMSKPQSNGPDLKGTVARPQEWLRKNTQIEAIASMRTRGKRPAVNCSIVPQSAPGTFSYRYFPVAPESNLAGGPAFLRGTVAPGELKRFLLQIDTREPVRSTRVTLRFDCENTRPTSAAIRIDTFPPNTTITSPALGVVLSRRARFRFDASEKPTSFECRIDSDKYRACVSPFVSHALVAGIHTFRVRAKDRDGNLDPSPAVMRWTVR